MVINKAFVLNNSQIFFDFSTLLYYKSFYIQISVKGRKYDNLRQFRKARIIICRQHLDKNPTLIERCNGFN